MALSDGDLSLELFPMDWPETLIARDDGSTDGRWSKLSLRSSYATSLPKPKEQNNLSYGLNVVDLPAYDWAYTSTPPSPTSSASSGPTSTPPSELDLSFDYGLEDDSTHAFTTSPTDTWENMDFSLSKLTTSTDDNDSITSYCSYSSESDSDLNSVDTTITIPATKPVDDLAALSCAAPTRLDRQLRQPRVNYLEHRWQAEDEACLHASMALLRSYASCTSSALCGDVTTKPAAIEPSVTRTRQQNVLWRTWAQTRHNLGRTSAKSVDWCKDEDQTFLYGPIETCDTKQQQSSTTAVVVVSATGSRSPAAQTLLSRRAAGTQPAAAENSAVSQTSFLPLESTALLPQGILKQRLSVEEMFKRGIPLTAEAWAVRRPSSEIDGRRRSTGDLRHGAEEGARRKRVRFSL